MESKENIAVPGGPEKLMKLKRPDQVPLGGKFFFKVPETGMELEHANSDLLFTMVLAHRKSNKLPPWTIDRVRAEVEDYMCRHLPDGVCRERDPRAKRGIILTRSMDQIRSFTRLIVERALRAVGGLPWRVSQEEAERRALICSGCEFNNRDLCTGCTGLKLWFAMFLVRGAETTQDSKLEVCGVCGCGLTVKVHVVKEAILTASKPGDPEYPVWCWLSDKSEGGPQPAGGSRPDQVPEMGYSGKEKMA